MMDKERSRRIDRARSTLTHALCELDERRYASALGLTACALTHLSSLTGETDWNDLLALIKRVQHERFKAAAKRV